MMKSGEVVVYEAQSITPSIKSDDVSIVAT